MRRKSIIVKKRKSPFLIRLLAGFTLCLSFIICSISIATAAQYTPIIVAKTNGHIEVKDNHINNLTLTPTLVFNRTGDSITYQTTIKSSQGSRFRIKKIADDNTSPYVSTSYQYDDTMNSEHKTVLIKLSYQKYLPFGEKLNLKDIHIAFDIEEEAQTSMKTSDDAKNTQSASDSASTQQLKIEHTSNQETKQTTKSSETTSETNVTTTSQPQSNITTTPQPQSNITTTPQPQSNITKTPEQKSNTTTTSEQHTDTTTTSEQHTDTTTTSEQHTDTTTTSEQHTNTTTSSEQHTDPATHQSNVPQNNTSAEEPLNPSPASSAYLNTAAPNTGAQKYELSKPEDANHDSILPLIIIGTIAIASFFIIVPFSIKSRVPFRIVGIFALIVLSTSFTSIRTLAASTDSQLNLTIVGANISAMPDSTNSQTVVSTIFPNIYNTSAIQTERNQQSKKLAPGNAIILKTLDNKYVLMDTGPKLTSIQNAIYSKLSKLQNNTTVTIDYLVISHLDSDHCGNAITMMHHPEKCKIKNIVLKHEKTATGSQDATFKSIVNEAAAQNIHIITSGDTETANYLTKIGVKKYDKLDEGMSLKIGKYLNLDFFNTTNVYAGKSCLSGDRIDWTSDIKSKFLLKTADKKYIYFDGSQYQFKDNGFGSSSIKYPNSNVTLKTTTKLVAKKNGSGMNQYFYARKASSTNICQSNPNSFGILAEVSTINQKRYMYFTGDIENAGYSSLSSGANSSQIYNSFTYKNGNFTGNITPYTISAEDDTANAVYNKIASDAASQNLPVQTLLNNIVLYQMSHHGGNNSEKAVRRLNLNRSSGIYAIQDGNTDMTNSPTFRLTKTYYYTFSNLPAENKISVFAKPTDSKKNGVSCTINTVGDANCNRY